MSALPSTSLWRLLSLRRDQAEPQEIDAAIRDATKFGGTNLWVLMFAIVIASVGLNVNSTAVIIGAMLISPLMGPIIGIGYGAGVHDYGFIRQSFRHLAFFVAISLLASTTYFLLSPLSQAYSELVARTTPTLWDVLIAFFGGAAGMIGLTRKEKTTLIPGVAIATALMPPLCTAGYGIATAQPQFFFGAFFLFLINSVFIALATLAIVRVLRLPHHTFPDEAARRRGRAIIAVAVSLTLAPSVFLAYQLVHQEFFSAAAQRFVRESVAVRDDVTLVLSDVDAKQREIALTLFGAGVTPAFEEDLRKQLVVRGLGDATLKLRHPSEEKLDVNLLRDELSRGIKAVVQDNAARVAALEARQAQAQQDMRPALPDTARIEAEIRVLFPAVRSLRVNAGIRQNEEGSERVALLVAVEATKGFAADHASRIKRWLETRFPNYEVDVAVGSLASRRGGR